MPHLPQQRCRMKGRKWRIGLATLPLLWVVPQIVGVADLDLQHAGEYLSLPFRFSATFWRAGGTHHHHGLESLIRRRRSGRRSFPRAFLDLLFAVQADTWRAL